jgi:3-oxoacyl-[acyl-carrier protein] reductase
MSSFGQSQVALVTGAAGSMGLATASMLAAEGYRVAMADLAGPKLDAAVAGIGAPARGFGFDVSDPAAVEAAFKKIESELGPVDVLINNAGILSNNKVAETTPDEWRKVLSVNLDGAFYLSRLIVPGMKIRRRGRIVNTCSFAMKSGGLTAGTAYTTSKGALAALTFSLARETVSFGITVNAIAPAYIRTPMVEEQLTQAQRDALLKQIPVGRFCEPEEFAHCVRFFLSPLSGFITGEILDLNGGLQFD